MERLPNIVTFISKSAKRAAAALFSLFCLTILALGVNILLPLKEGYFFMPYFPTRGRLIIPKPMEVPL